MPEMISASHFTSPLHAEASFNPAAPFYQFDKAVLVARQMPFERLLRWAS
jgi:hypothetical protein